MEYQSQYYLLDNHVLLHRTNDILQPEFAIFNQIMVFDHLQNQPFPRDSLIVTDIDPTMIG